jgi:hypothetical protein
MVQHVIIFATVLGYFNMMAQLFLRFYRYDGSNIFEILSVIFKILSCHLLK